VKGAAWLVVVQSVVRNMFAGSVAVESTLGTAPP